MFPCILVSNWNYFRRCNKCGCRSYGAVINRANTIFVARADTGNVMFWKNGSTTTRSTIATGVSSPLAMFVTDNEKIFLVNNCPKNRVEYWDINGTLQAAVLTSGSSCSGLFIDIYNDLYCSEYQYHQVVKKPLMDPSNQITIVAGTGCSSSSDDGLDDPMGIFVDKSRNLYVADSANNRIQRFSYGQTIGVTVAGNGFGSISLSSPVAVMLDADGFLFILEYGTNQLLGSNANGFRCVAGCNGDLYRPWTFGFDSLGNIFVLDRGNNRTQKYTIQNNTCGKYNIFICSFTILCFRYNNTIYHGCDKSNR